MYKASRIVKEIEYLWRHLVVYPVLQRLLNNPEYEAPIDIHSIRSILFLRNDRIGDMIVTTPIFRNIKKINPDLKVGVFARKTNIEIIRHNPCIDYIYVSYSNWFKLSAEILKARRHNYDVIIHLVFNRMTSGGILANIISPSGIKVGQGNIKYKFYFNKFLNLSRYSIPMVETLASVMEHAFDIKFLSNRLNYEIIIDRETRERVDKYLLECNLRLRSNSDNNKAPYIVFNLSANDRDRRISHEQAYAIGKCLASNSALRTILLIAPDDRRMNIIKQQLMRNERCLSFPEQGKASILEIAALIEGSVAVITPDTSIIHFASAAKTPVLGIYTQMQDIHEWLPYRVKNKIVMSEDNQPVSSIPIQVLHKAVEEFIQELSI